MDARDAESLVRQYASGWPAGTFLAQLTPETRSALLSAGTAASFRPDEEILTQGSLATDVYILIDACVKVTAQHARGESLLAIRMSGDVVGELAAIDSSPRLATVRACRRDRSIAVAVEGDTFTSILSQSSADNLVFSSVVAQKFRSATRRRANYTDRGPEARMALSLLELAQSYGLRNIDGTITIRLNITQIELGMLIGVSKATAERALTELRSDQLVKTSHRQVSILNPSGLAALARTPNPSNEG